MTLPLINCLRHIQLFVACVFMLGATGFGATLHAADEKVAFSTDQLVFGPPVIQLTHAHGRPELHIRVDVTNTSAHVISGVWVEIAVMADRPAPIATLHFRDFGKVIPGGLLPGETMRLTTNRQLSQRAGEMIGDPAALVLDLRYRNVVDASGDALLCVADARKNAGSHKSTSAACP